MITFYLQRSTVSFSREDHCTMSFLSSIVSKFAVPLCCLFLTQLGSNAERVCSSNDVNDGDLDSYYKHCSTEQEPYQLEEQYLEWSCYDANQTTNLRPSEHLTLETAKDNEHDLNWSQLSETRQAYWEAKGYDENRWDDVDAETIAQSTPEWFRPLLVNFTVPQLSNFTMDRLREERVNVRLVDGYNLDEGNEDFTATMPLGDMVDNARSGNTDYYLHLEESMWEKEHLQHIGDQVVDGMLDAIKSNKMIQDSGLWKPEWDDLDRSELDWVLFLGAEGTRSPMHYDSDEFNILYVLEGNKRFVMLPNDQRTEGLFSTWLNEDGGTGWGDYNLLATPLPEHGVEVELHAGQALVVPYLCWHAVENLETSLAYAIRV
jgi:hypothetical protein